MNRSRGIFFGMKMFSNVLLDADWSILHADWSAVHLPSVSDGGGHSSGIRAVSDAEMSSACRTV